MAQRYPESAASVVEFVLVEVTWPGVTTFTLSYAAILHTMRIYEETKHDQSVLLHFQDIPSSQEMASVMLSDVMFHNIHRIHLG